MNITFRRGTPPDAESFLPLIEAFYAVDDHAYDQDRIRPALEMLLADSRYGRAWFIERDGFTVGYVIVTYGFSLESGGRDALIDEFYIDAENRGKGIGAYTVEFLRQHCRDEGISVLYLEVENHNIRARAFYERVGFLRRRQHLHGDADLAKHRRLITIDHLCDAVA